jgi:hypothetical protein
VPVLLTGGLITTLASALLALTPNRRVMPVTV